jgi:hypothetical protein
MIRRFVYGTFIIGAIAAGLCIAYPEPAVLQSLDQWTLQVTFEHPQQITLPQAGPGLQNRFWYTIVTLTNRTNHDVDFYPRSELMTDEFQIIPAGVNTPPRVFELIKKRHHSRYPLLESFTQVANRILEGEDNAKDIAVIWPDFDHDATEIKIFVEGLSNETVAIKHPIKPQGIYLRKSLELTYSVKGDPALKSALKLQYKGKRWVMR